MVMWYKAICSVWIVKAHLGTGVNLTADDLCNCLRTFKTGRPANSTALQPGYTDVITRGLPAMITSITGLPVACAAFTSSTWSAGEADVGYTAETFGVRHLASGYYNRACPRSFCFYLDCGVSQRDVATGETPSGGQCIR